MARIPAFFISYIRHIVYRAYHWLLTSIRIQVVLFLISLPFLATAGLPLSSTSIIGNLLFAPFATLFLVLSAIWCICHLATAPTYLIVYYLEQLVTWWTWGLSWGSSSMLFAVPKCHPLILIFIPLTTCLVLFSSLRSRWGIEGEVATLILMGLLWCLGLKTYAVSQNPIPLSHGGGIVWLNPQPEGVALVDITGTLRNLPASSSWATFTLSAALAQHFGACSCKYIVIMKPTLQRLSAAATLIRSGKAKELVAPDWIIAKKWWQKWRKAYPELKVQHIPENALSALYLPLCNNSDKLDFDST